MHPTSGTLISLGHRLGTLGVTLLLLLATASILALALVLSISTDLFAAGADPTQVAPVRWTQRC